MKSYHLMFVGLIAMQGCGIVVPMVKSEGKLASLSIGKDRSDIVTEMGRPTAVRASERLSDGRVLQVDEYRLFRPNAAMADAFTGLFTATYFWWAPNASLANLYWVRYMDNKIDGWGQAGDGQPMLTGDFTIRNK